jgi:hypothetical protein
VQDALNPDDILSSAEVGRGARVRFERNCRYCDAILRALTADDDATAASELGKLTKLCENRAREPRS